MIELLDDYQKQALRTAAGLSKDDALMNAALGLSGETGEIADLIKKHKYQGHHLDRQKAIEELGDVMWYCSLMAYALNIDLSEVADRNIMKLSTRYPSGFDPNRSINRPSQRYPGTIGDIIINQVEISIYNDIVKRKIPFTGRFYAIDPETKIIKAADTENGKLLEDEFDNLDEALRWLRGVV